MASKLALVDTFSLILTQIAGRGVMSVTIALCSAVGMQ